MYVLYVDDAGTAGHQGQTHFILAGIALFERHIEHLEGRLNQIADATGLPDPETLEFHGSQMQPGSKRWRAIRGEGARRQVICDALCATSVLRGPWALFGVVIDKAAISPLDPIEYAFEQLCGRFDQFLRRSRRNGQPQRGLIVLDRSAHETRLQELAATFRREGHPGGRMRNIVDVPFFVDSGATRAIQYADLVTYALWRRFERGDPTFFDLIAPHFDRFGGVVHGLLHAPLPGTTCTCPSCNSRRPATGAPL